MEHILHRSLKLIERIYDDTMYERNDFFRIKDVIHSLDSKQIESKKWLVEHFSKLYRHGTTWNDTTNEYELGTNNHEDGNILIIGGWYGLLPYLLRQEFTNPSFNITSVDKDPVCEEFAWELFHDIDVDFQTLDAFDLDYSKYNAIISTSVEHIEKEFWMDLLNKKNRDCWFCFQSNDYFEHDTHINCSNNLDEFASYLGYRIDKSFHAPYEGILNLKDFNRFMVIGK